MPKTTLSEMPNVRMNAKSGSDLMNYIVQNNDILLDGMNGRTFTRDNFVEMSNYMWDRDDLRTQFLYELFDKIGLTYVASNAYYNRLKDLKKDTLNNGDIVEELALDKIEPMPYNPEINWRLQFKNFPSVYGDLFHRINRAQVYPVTINEALLKRSMTSEQTFLDYVNQILENLVSSNEIDEFRYFLDDVNYVAEKDSYPVSVVKPYDETSYKELVAQINTYANNLTFASRNYNMFNFDRATPKERLMLITTSDILAHLNAFVMSGAFNVELIKFLVDRTIVVPELPQNCLALLCDDRIFQIYDVLYATDTNHNSLTLSDNHFLHVQQIISASPQFNSVVFMSEKPEDAVIASVEPADGTILYQGRTYNIDVKLSNDTYSQVKYELDGNNDENTQLTPYGLLYIGQKEDAEEITVKVTVYGGATQTLTYKIAE